MSERDTVALLGEVMQPLEPWGSDPAVEEICLQEPNKAWVRKDGAWNVHAVALDYDDLYDMAILGAALRRQTVGARSPIVGEDIPFCGATMRLQSVLPPAVMAGTVAHSIRRFEHSVAPVSRITQRYDTSRWNQWEHRDSARTRDFSACLDVYDSGDIEAFLDACVQLHLNVLLTGATGSGKTTLARSMTALVDMDERIITIEDALELVVPHPNNVRLLYSKGGLSSDGVTAQSLVDACLRMRPDRIIFQELRDAEAAYMFVNEALTGHPGCITTIHGGTATAAARRLFSLIKGSDAGKGLGDETVYRLIGDAVDVIMPLHNAAGNYAIRETWFVADAARRGETAADLLKERPHGN